QISGSECGSECDHDDVQLVFGDSILLRRLRRRLHTPGEPCSLASAKFVWVTMGDESSAHAAKAAGEIHEHLPFDCMEEELFEVVHRLVVSDASDAWRTPLPPRAGQARRTALGGLAPGALRRVREHIDRHLTENVRTEVLARIAKLSLGYF